MKKTILLSVFFLVISIGTSLCQVIGFQINDGEKRVTIPFELHNNLIVVKIILNDAIPLKFILDSGVKTTILTEKTFSDLLSISYDREINLVGATGGKPVKAYVANNVSLQLPGIRGVGQALLVLEEDYLQLKHNIGEDVHGILGYEIFRRFIVKIDYINRTLTLYEPHSFKSKRSFKRLSLSIENSKPYLLTRAVINDSTEVDVKLMIDTGASQSFLLDPASNAKITVPEKIVAGKLGRGLSGDIIGHFGRIQRLTIDAYRFEDAIAAFPTKESYKMITQSTNRNGTLGAGFLNRFHVIFDYFNEYLYLKKNKNYKAPFEYNLSGFDIHAVGPQLRTFQINYVRSNSPAEKSGLKVGDILLLVNGHSTKGMKFSDVFHYLSGKNGKTLKLRVKRGEENFLIKFKLQRFI